MTSKVRYGVGGEIYVDTKKIQSEDEIDIKYGYYGEVFVDFGTGWWELEDAIDWLDKAYTFGVLPEGFEDKTSEEEIVSIWEALREVEKELQYEKED